MVLKKKKKAEPMRRRLITKHNPKSPVSEQYRTIRTNIQFSSVDKNIQSIMVTSSGPGEGKSTTVANLAIVFAQQGKRVLLVDADLRKPTMHYTFGLSNTVGLSNVLSKQKTFNEAIKPSSTDSLDILTSGPIPPNPAELLSSLGMAAFMREAKETYDLILFDTPPVLAVTDAQILSNQCDGTILVILSGKTEVEAAEKTKELLISVQSNILGTVLNRKRAAKKETHYYYENR